MIIAIGHNAMGTSIQHHPRARVAGQNGGFSLVEGLVSAALVALGFLAVLNLYPSAYSTLTYAGNEILAAEAAAQKI